MVQCEVPKAGRRHRKVLEEFQEDGTRANPGQCAPGALRLA